MNQATLFASPWYVAGLRRIAESVAAIADDLDRAFEDAPVEAVPVEAAPTPDSDYRVILARAAEESLANTRDRLSRYY
jgi:hypothetical protein